MIASNQDCKPTIVHIASGDLWAGAESQIFNSLRELKKYYKVHAFLMNEGELAARLRKHGIPVEIFDENKLSSIKIFFRIRRELLLLKPMIVHTHRKKENIIGSLANFLGPRAKCVRTAHGAPEFVAKGMGKLLNLLDGFCGNYLQDKVIAVSEELREKLQSRFKTRKLVTVLNGLDPNELSSVQNRAAFKLTGVDDIHIGIVGRLEPVKRVDIFLSAADILARRNPALSWQFHIFGSGSLESELKSVRNGLSSKDKILFHGHLSQIHEAIRSLDVLVMCSDHEGLPMTALEALALGTPVVAHKVGGLVELLADYPNWLVENHQAEFYALAVEALINNRPAEIRFPAAHNISSTTAHLKSVYESLF